MVSGRNKFLVGGLFILAAVVYLIISSTKASVEYFKTVDELLAQRETVMGKSIRLSGAVVGDTITYNPDSLTLSFEVAHIPGKNEEIDAERGVIHEEWRTGRSAMFRMMREATKTLFKDSKYATHDVIGDINLLDTFPYEAIKRFYTT